jgi:hypothetical protein
MGKKESPNKKEASSKKEAKPQSPGGGKPFVIPEKVFAVIKFILGLCMLPMVYSATRAFGAEFSVASHAGQGYFWGGVITFILIYLFIWEPVLIYESGHRLVETVFGFFQPFVRVAPNVLPIYAIIVFLFFCLGSLFIKGPWFLRSSLFLAGFFVALHLVFSIRPLRTGKEDFLKSHFIFSASFIYIINVLLSAFFLSVFLKGSSFGDFVTRTVSVYRDIFYAVFKQLFLY